MNALRKKKDSEASLIDIRGYIKVYSGEDFYILIDENGDIETYCLDDDYRAKLEMDMLCEKYNKVKSLINNR